MNAITPHAHELPKNGLVPYNYATAEICQIAEEKLASVNCNPQYPAPVPIELAAEKLADVSYSSKLAKEYLGITLFSANRPPQIIINERLSRPKNTWEINLLRETISHELAHSIYHNHLFRPELLPPNQKACAYLLECMTSFSREYEKPYDYQGLVWYELQACIGAEALLMPQTQLLKLMHMVLKKQTELAEQLVTQKLMLSLFWRQFVCCTMAFFQVNASIAASATLRVVLPHKALILDTLKAARSQWESHGTHA